MTITRSGASKEYSSNWEKAFRKKKSAKPSSSPAKGAKKKASAKKKR